MLRHALVYRVEQVFLIHAETGLLLAHAASPDLKVTDADLISGMLTAIQDFVGDSFAPTEAGGALRTFSVGEVTVMVERGPQAALAAVVRGQAPETLLPRLQDTLETVHLQFPGLAEYNGDVPRSHRPARCWKSVWRRFSTPTGDNPAQCGEGWSGCAGPFLRW